MSVEVGDLIRLAQASGDVFMVVQEIDSVYANWYGNFGIDVEEAKRLKRGKHPLQWGQVSLREFLEGTATIVERARAIPTPPVAGACSCPWSLLARGCECGAIKPYKIVIGG